MKNRSLNFGNKKSKLTFVENMKAMEKMKV